MLRFKYIERLNEIVITSFVYNVNTVNGDN